MRSVEILSFLPAMGEGMHRTILDLPHPRCSFQPWHPTHHAASQQRT